ncbi:xylulokinase [Lachnospiraceae bacterium OttesenSCG-928-E19]|nr:xylulokinase [Lachnospiraceae bacterium OttesenSCG-928-E19]
MKYYLGIDIGTSAAKVIAIDEKGTMVSRCENEYQYSKPKPGWKEIQPHVWTEAAKKGIKEVLTELNPQKIKAIGVSGQMHTTVFLDEKGSSIRPAIMWNDTRTEKYFPELKIMMTQKDTRSIKKIISTGSPAANLLWLKEHEPESFAKLHKFLIGPDYLVYYLTGKYSTDYCQASTSSLYDTEELEWSETMRQLIGLKQEVYPPIKGSQEVVGTLCLEIQNEFGFSNDVKVVAGTGDNPAAAISTGSIQHKYPVLSIGTSGVLVLPRNEVKEGSKGKEILFSLDGKNITHMVQGAVQSAGGSYGWYVKNILGLQSYDDISDSVDVEHIGEGKVLFYPHLTGDKTIYGDSTLRGAFLGLDINDTKEELAVAVMEGVCFAIKQLLEEMKLVPEELEELLVTGGGANSDLWMQILANILNVKIVQLDSNEGASYGAAILARNSVQKTIYEEKKEELVKRGNQFIPEESQIDCYLKKYKMYLKIHKAMQMIYE